MSTQPQATLYLNNLNEKIHKDELRIQLYALFTTYGKIIDIIASKSPAMRGQAFLVFSDLTGATSALRACDGMVFYDKPMRIAYAKNKSYATSKREDPNFVPPNSANASALVQNGVLKRRRDDSPDAREAKRKADEQSDEEMEIDDDDDESDPPAPTYSSEIFPPQVHHPTARLLCTNLPQEVSNDVLSVLFQPHNGFISTRVVESPNPSSTGEKTKVAQTLFKNAELATAAREALNGFTLKKGWSMTVVYI
ncbi:hypothetical protein CPB85DRAFT_1292502 [Mucidula mucida]|nr:hypothetical protein CPB85DRAFT_1292502 [Mucidula mucida]